MAHYAFLDENNIVTEIIVGRNEWEIVDGISDWEEHYSIFRGQKCLRTSYNTFKNSHINGGTAFRGNYASIGSYFDEDLDAFIPPKPYNSWILDTENLCWIPPIAYPEDNNNYYWDEDSQNWILASE